MRCAGRQGAQGDEDLCFLHKLPKGKDRGFRSRPSYCTQDTVVSHTLTSDSVTFEQ